MKLFAFLLLLWSSASAAEVNAKAKSPYAPKPIACPSGSLVRPASDGVSPLEKTWVTARKKKADIAFASWVAAEQSVTFGKPVFYPVLAMSTSGGGFRSMLTSAGIHAAFDTRDTFLTTSGLYQALTYEAGLSGGAWLLSSLAASNWTSVSNLNIDFWQTSLSNRSILSILSNPAEIRAITNDLNAKNATGFPLTITDLYGRLLSWMLLEGADGGVVNTMSGITTKSNFISHSVPFPILTSVAAGGGVSGNCQPGADATQYEFTPFEFGSWDDGVAAFARTKFLGSSLSGGYPVNQKSCRTGYDNLGFVLATSSNAIVGACQMLPAALAATLEYIVQQFYGNQEPSFFSAYPNPFFSYANSPAISGAPTLYLDDGALSGQNVPIWPFLRRGVGGPPQIVPTIASRSSSSKLPWNVDVLIVSDNGDGPDGYPDGSALYQTLNYSQSGMTPPEQLQGMPDVPAPDEFVKQGLNKRPVLFGCDDSSQLLILYLPNQEISYNSSGFNVSTKAINIPPDVADSLIENGINIALADDRSSWNVCIRCAMMLRGNGVLPAECNACFDDLCWRQPGCDYYDNCPICVNGGGQCLSYELCNTAENCYCGYDTGNNIICFQDEACDTAPACSENTDCADGWACLEGSCCNKPVCAPVTVCENPASAVAIFRKPQVGAKSTVHK